MGRLEFFHRTREPERSNPAPRGPGPGLEVVREKLGGNIIKDGQASIMEVGCILPASHIHGKASLGQLLGVDLSALKVLFPALAGEPAQELCLEDLVFFDIETTGLSTGAGTYVFLVGLLRFHGQEVHLKQYFLNNLSSERLFLEVLTQGLNADRVLVSYNGKCFDYPLVKNRCILNGFSPDRSDPQHLDLLYPSRRIWKGIFSDFCLQTVEKMALGVNRWEDIPGYLVPEIYFQYLQHQDVTEKLLGVFRHNKTDVLSLAALLLKQLHLINSEINGQRNGQPKEVYGTPDISGAPGISREYNPLSVSDMLLCSNYRSEAKSILDRHNQNTDALKRLALIFKREGSFGNALVYMEAMAQKAGRLSEFIFACTEIAKIYEHRLKNLQKALSYTERAWQRVRRMEVMWELDTHMLKKYKQELEKRLNRLKKRVQAAVLSPDENSG
ncbi:MAG: ribonuclease H-like domain-containing protein [Spirochaetota bacterium]